jgi:tight adherence protein C
MNDIHLSAHLLGACALAAAALAAALSGVLAFSRYARMQRSGRTLEQALTQRAPVAAAAPAATAAARPPRGVLAAIALASVDWLDTPLGRIAVANEDRKLLERCGYLDARARGLFLAARLAGAAAAPLVVAALAHGGAHVSRLPLYYFMAAACGFMAPKWIVRRRADARQRAVSAELPMFVDLLRLLQGVGLSLDQSMQVMIHDFTTVLPVLARELTMAQAQFVTGRTREQSLRRLATAYDNDDLAAIVRLVIQVEQHGGAVQEPLRQFGDRLRDSRRAMLRERIGKLTVKMTGVMVVTLLPALLIVTAGPGFIAIVHSLSNFHR